MQTVMVSKHPSCSCKGLPCSFWASEHLALFRSKMIVRCHPGPANFMLSNACVAMMLFCMVALTQKEDPVSYNRVGCAARQEALMYGPRQTECNLPCCTYLGIGRMHFYRRPDYWFNTRATARVWICNSTKLAAMTSPIQLSTFTFAVWEVVVQHGRPQGSLCRAVPLLQTNAWPDAKTQLANILRGYTCQAPFRKGCQTQQSRNCEGEKRLPATPSHGRVGKRELLYQRRCSAAYEVSRQLSAGS